jgi:transposase, IS5 family
MTEEMMNPPSSARARCGKLRDRLSFMRFLDLELEDPMPDATTIWLFREALAEAGLIDKLFERFGQHLEAAGYCARRPDH